MCTSDLDGLYEWKRTETYKQPFDIHLKGSRPFFFAGIYEAATELRPETFLLFTTQPNELMAAIHDRMPAILTGPKARKWLTPGPLSPEAFAGFTAPHAADDMEAVPVSSYVNNARNDMALRCYLKTDVMRLCAPEERVHLAWLVRRYGAHEKAYEQALLGTIARLRGRATVELAKGEDPAAAYGRAVAEAARPLQNAEFRRAAEIEILLDREVTALFGAVVRVGLLTRADLGGPIPEAIERAFKPGEGVALPGFHPCRLGA